MPIQSQVKGVSFLVCAVLDYCSQANLSYSTNLLYDSKAGCGSGVLSLSLIERTQKSSAGPQESVHERQKRQRPKGKIDALQ